MDARYSITTARPHDLARLPAIELAAARLLAPYAPASVLAETTAWNVLLEAQREGRLWVALADDVAVGFAHVEIIERDVAHLEELDVDPPHGRRGLGTRLVVQVCDWAAEHGYGSVTLTTFADVPWNMPFYARLGFEVVAHAQLGGALGAIVADETRRGLDPARRVVMRRATRNLPMPELRSEHVSIRAALVEERASLEALQRRASLANPGDRDALLANPDAIAVPAEQIADGCVFVAEHDGVAVGFAAVVPRSDGGAELDALFVEPHLWKRGIGRQLVEHVVDVARARNASALHVVGNPHAEGFYVSCGFRVTGTVETRFGAGLGMEREL